MREFKVGDKVKIISEYELLPYGSVGIIVSGPRGSLSGGNYTVKVDQKVRTILGENLKLITPKPRKVGRPNKLYFCPVCPKGEGVPSKAWYDVHMLECHTTVSPTEVTFKITKLDDGTELIFIPLKEWAYRYNLDSTHVVYRKVKK